MAEITASMVMALRSKTDAPMMDCKKALIEAKGDMQRGEEILRVRFGNKASKASSRIAAEGVVSSFITNDGKSGCLIPGGVQNTSNEYDGSRWTAGNTINTNRYVHAGA